MTPIVLPWAIVTGVLEEVAVTILRIAQEVRNASMQYTRRYIPEECHLTFLSKRSHAYRGSSDSRVNLEMFTEKPGNVSNFPHFIRVNFRAPFQLHIVCLFIISLLPHSMLRILCCLKASSEKQQTGNHF
jgi:hypothetical protein